MEVEQVGMDTWEGYVDWKNKPAKKGHHGGMIAAFFVLVVEVMENLAYLANASNLVLYLTEHMHFSPIKAANNVTESWELLSFLFFLVASCLMLSSQLIKSTS